MEYQISCNRCNNVINFTKRELHKKKDIPTKLKNFPVLVQVLHDGYWITKDNIHTSTNDNNCDNNSIMLSPDSLLYVYKLALRHYLLSKQIISPKDIDPQNLVPHIVVRKNKKDPHNNFDSIQKEKFTINEDKISIKSNFMIIELDESRDLHMTLVFSKGINKKIDLKTALDTVVSYLNDYPEMIQTYKQLKYFGEDHTLYWYNTPDSFPFKINKPVDFQQERKIEPNYILSPAGTILNTL
jgi:hypothetical protein